MIKKLFFVLLALLVLLVAYVLFNTFTFESIQKKYEPVEAIEVNTASIDRFSAAIKIQTVSPEIPADFDSAQFQQFDAFLKATYPLTDSLLAKKVFNDFSYLYRWEGSDKSLQPIVLMGHLDVVPVIEANLPAWRHQPFGGEVVNDTIWGRGTIDDKIGVIGLMESVERLLSEGFSPKRTVYLAFGHDEELGGDFGAKAIAAYLKENGVKAAYIIDEGGTITQKLVPGIQKDVALIGIAEKGFLSLKLSVSIEGGHSSMPEKETSIDVLSTAISKLKRNPLPAEISPPIEAFMQALGPEMAFVNKMAFANKALFNSLIISIYEASGSGNALVRTTTAPTIFNAGVKENSIPMQANATVNFRIIPGMTADQIVEHTRQTINDDRITITKGDFISEASKISSIESAGYETLSKTIGQIYPETLISPYLVVGGTDSRHYYGISENIYRFLPIKLNFGNIKSFHGINERISVTEYKNAIRFYYQLIKNGTGE